MRSEYLIKAKNIWVVTKKLSINKTKCYSVMTWSCTALTRRGSESRAELFTVPLLGGIFLDRGQLF